MPLRLGSFTNQYCESAARAHVAAGTKAMSEALRFVVTLTPLSWKTPNGDLGGDGIRDGFGNAKVNHLDDGDVSLAAKEEYFRWLGVALDGAR